MNGGVSMSIEKLVENHVFSYKVTKDNKIFIYYHQQQVMIVVGKDAQKLLRRLTAADASQEQSLLAKITGNFKRGNER